MFKREMKINLKSFIIWTSVLMILFLIVFLMYPSIMNSENMKMMDEMLKIFPEEMLKAFNMDISSIDTAFGWMRTEGFSILMAWRRKRPQKLSGMLRKAAAAASGTSIPLTDGSLRMPRIRG